MGFSLELLVAFLLLLAVTGLLCHTVLPLAKTDFSFADIEERFDADLPARAFGMGRGVYSDYQRFFNEH